MALRFHPKAGMILICKYSQNGFIAPEMTKTRPVIVVSPKFRHRSNLCTVVPLSTTPPFPIQQYHYLLKIDPPLPPPFDQREAWVKCDMISSVSFERLNLIHLERDKSGKRAYYTQQILAEDLEKIRKGIMASIRATS